MTTPAPYRSNASICVFACWRRAARASPRSGRRKPCASWCRSAPARRRTSSPASSPTDCRRNIRSSIFVVENKPGASGNLGTDAVAKAAPDGATIGISIGGPLAINTLLFSNLPYDPHKDIAPITQLVTQPSVLAVNPELKVNRSPNWWRCSKPIPANTISPRSATARCRISRWRRSPSKPAPNWCTCPMPVRRRPSPRSCAATRRWPACRRFR